MFLIFYLKFGAGFLNMDRENVGKMWRKSRYSPHFRNMLSTACPQNTHPHNREISIYLYKEDHGII